MARVERFEDLVAWQKARLLAREVYQVTRQGGFAKDFGLAGQIERAAVSVSSNIAEGVERSGLGDLNRFLIVARASAAEVRSQLYIAHDVGHLDGSTFCSLLALTEEVGRIIGGLRPSIERRRTTQDG